MDWAQTHQFFRMWSPARIVHRSSDLLRHRQADVPLLSCAPRSKQECLLLFPRECTTESPSQKPGNHPNYLFVPHSCTFIFSIRSCQYSICNVFWICLFLLPQSQMWVSPAVSCLYCWNSPDPSPPSHWHFLQAFLQGAVGVIFITHKVDSVSSFKSFNAPHPHCIPTG